MIYRQGMYALFLVGITGLLATLLRFNGADLSGLADKQPILEMAFAILLAVPLFWAVRRIKASSLRTIGFVLIGVFVLVLIGYVAPDDFVNPEGSYTKVFQKLMAPAVLVAFLLVATLYEKKRNEKATKGYVLRFGMAFKKVCDGYDAISEEGCSMRNTPYGVEFYDAEGNPTGFRATDIATKWKVIKEGSE